MKFDFKDEDVKSWKDRHDVKVGDIGFVACVTNELALTIATITEIIDDTGKCFVAQPLNANVEREFSLYSDFIGHYAIHVIVPFLNTEYKFIPLFNTLQVISTERRKL